ncbi:hypothetical protein IQ07DRAFT_651957 [Pyrenochaeta sp. DS3sAY3a]|nr:hypothetical protein IQ07DRAFT_651957 [Pyrenochaeta sp. DS3sAY3a]
MPPVLFYFPSLLILTPIHHPSLPGLFVQPQLQTHYTTPMADPQEAVPIEEMTTEMMVAMIALLMPSATHEAILGKLADCDGTVEFTTASRFQLLFTRNLSPLQSSKFSFEYLLLPPRSALEAVRPRVTPKASSRASTPAYSPGLKSCPDGWMLLFRKTKKKNRRAIKPVVFIDDDADTSQDATIVVDDDADTSPDTTIVIDDDTDTDASPGVTVVHNTVTQNRYICSEPHCPYSTNKKQPFIYLQFSHGRGKWLFCTDPRCFWAFRNMRDINQHKKLHVAQDKIIVNTSLSILQPSTSARVQFSTHQLITEFISQIPHPYRHIIQQFTDSEQPRSSLRSLPPLYTEAREMPPLHAATTWPFSGLVHSTAE